MIYIVSILFTLAFIMYSKYQFADFKTNPYRKWKPYGMAMRALFFIGCFSCFHFGNSWQDYLLAGSINILLWEWGINVIALNAPSILYVGTTGKIDKAVGKYKWWAMAGLIIISIIIKIIT